MKTEMPFASFTYSEHNRPELSAEKNEDRHGKLENRY